MEEQKPKKKIPKVKVSICLSRSVWDKAKKIQEIAGVTPSVAINYVLKSSRGLEKLIEYYQNQDKKEEGLEE